MKSSEELAQDSIAKFRENNPSELDQQVTHWLWLTKYNQKISEKLANEQSDPIKKAYFLGQAKVYQRINKRLKKIEL